MDNKKYLQDYARQKFICIAWEDTKAAALKELDSLPPKAFYNNASQAERNLIRTLRQTIAACETRSAEARRKCEEIRAAVDGVQDLRQRAILQMRYLQDPPETWERIADKLGYTFEHCHNLHRQALENITP